MKPRSAKPALSLWLIDHRKAATMKPADVARAIGVSEDTVRGWEAGRGIGQDSIPALEALFGEGAPTAGAPGQANGDVAAAIRENTAAIRDQTEMLRQVLERLTMPGAPVDPAALAAWGIAQETPSPRRRPTAPEGGRR